MDISKGTVVMHSVYTPNTILPHARLRSNTNALSLSWFYTKQIFGIIKLIFASLKSQSQMFFHFIMSFNVLPVPRKSIWHHDNNVFKYVTSHTKLKPQPHH